MLKILPANAEFLTVTEVFVDNTESKKRVSCDERPLAMANIFASNDDTTVRKHKYLRLDLAVQ